MFVAVFLQAWFGAFTNDVTIDSYSYFFAADALSRGLNPYDTATLQSLKPDEIGFVFPYLYPPPLAYAWRLLLPLGAEGAHRLTILAGTLLAAVNALLMWRLVRPKRHPGAVYLFFVLFHALCGPLVSTLRLGQINVVVVLLVLLALHAEVRDRPNVAGLCLAAATLLKITPAIFVIDLLLRGRWRTLLATAAWTIALASASIAVGGVQPWLDFLARAKEPLPFNPPMSVRGLLDLLCSPLGWGRSVRVVLFLAVVTAIVGRVVRRLVAVEADPVISWSALALGSLLLFPLTWHHHYYLALLSFSCFASRAYDEGKEGRVALWLVLGAAALLRYPGVLHPLKPLAALIAVFAF